MRIDLSGALRDALERWRRDRDILIAVGGVFFFLPALAMALLLPRRELPQPAANADPEASQAVMRAAIDLLVDNAHWLIGQSLLELFGAAVLLVLAFDPARATVREAMGTALRRMPVLIAAAIGTGVVTLAGLLLFILPGAYVVGRTFVVTPVLIAEPNRPLADAIVRAVLLTRRHGIALFAIAAAIFLCGQVALLTFGAIGTALAGGGVNPITHAMVAATAGLASAAVSIAFVLVRIAVYQRLAAAPSRG